jgi:Tfp pilus assembly protein PilO
MKLSSRDQMIAAGVGIAIVAVAFVFLLIMPQFTQLRGMDAQMAKADSDMQAAKSLLASREEAKAAAAETQAKLTRLDNEIPDAPELAALIIDLQDTANDAGVQWDKLAPGKPGDTGTGFQRISVTFSIEGQWDDIVDYVRRLRELERAVRVLQLDILPLAPTASAASTSTVGAGPEKLQANVSVEVYSLPRNTSTAPGAPGAPAQ